MQSFFQELHSHINKNSGEKFENMLNSKYFLKRNYHKITHRIVVLTFTARFPLESAVSDLKGEQRPQ